MAWLTLAPKNCADEPQKPQDRFGKIRNSASGREQYS